MDRREAIRRVSMLMGGTVAGAELFISCGPSGKKGTAGEGGSAGGKEEDLAGSEHIPLLNEIGETILPATSTPGAKEADVGTFMLIMVRDCYNESNRQAFYEGIGKLGEASTEKYGKPFMQLDPQQRESFLTGLDEEQEQYTRKKKREEPIHYFRMMKEMTLLGYFTSEVGATQALRYVAVPGRYDGDVPYKKGDRAWAG